MELLTVSVLKLPMPFAIWAHIFFQKRRENKRENCGYDSQILLPIYNHIICFYIIYVIARFLDRMLGFSSYEIVLPEILGAPARTDNIYRAILFFIMGEGVLTFLIFILFGFLTAPSSGRFALRSATIDAVKFLMIYSLLYVTPMIIEVDTNTQLLLKLLDLAVIITFVSVTLAKMVWTQSPRWTSTTYLTLVLMLGLLISYFAMCIFSMANESSLSVSLRPVYDWVFIVFYDFLLPLLMYKILIDDSRYWRNFEKELSHLKGLETFKIE